tara:strand:+ start:40 stop:618 length:579 start_codon:yes stop_codon:yes gene_type:complete
MPIQINSSINYEVPRIIYSPFQFGRVVQYPINEEGRPSREFKYRQDITNKDIELLKDLLSNTQQQFFKLGLKRKIISVEILEKFIKDPFSRKMIFKNSQGSPLYCFGFKYEESLNGTGILIKPDKYIYQGAVVDGEWSGPGELRRIKYDEKGNPGVRQIYKRTTGIWQRRHFEPRFSEKDYIGSLYFMKNDI